MWWFILVLNFCFRCIRSWWRRHRTRAGLCSGVTLTFPDSMTRSAIVDVILLPPPQTHTRIHNTVKVSMYLTNFFFFSTPLTPSFSVIYRWYNKHISIYIYLDLSICVCVSVSASICVYESQCVCGGTVCVCVSLCASVLVCVSMCMGISVCLWGWDHGVSLFLCVSACLSMCMSPGLCVCVLRGGGVSVCVSLCVLWIPCAPPHSCLHILYLLWKGDEKGEPFQQWWTMLVILFVLHFWVIST